MAREKNSIGSTTITLSVTETIKEYLDELTLTGFYGKNAAETAAHLLREKIRDTRIQENMARGNPTPGRSGA